MTEIHSQAAKDELFMAETLELARKGLRNVDPNPMVGCLLVRNGIVVGRGYHGNYGGPHAEVAALEDAGDAAHGATAYVSLEPCSTEYAEKKTPPCAPALVSAGVKRVVIATTDPNPNVSGAGIRLLRDAGIEVTTDVLNREAAHLIRGFLHWIRHRRPYVILKEAQTADGYVAAKLQGDRWFTSPAARTWVHQLRAEVGGILVGRVTAESDNPSLTVRDAKGAHPIRIVLDSQGRLPENLSLFADRAAPTWKITTVGESEETAWGERIVISEGRSQIDPAALLDELGRRNMTTLLVEGGPAVHRSFLKSELAQEMVIVQSSVETEEAVKGLPELECALKIDQEWQVIETITNMPESIVIAQKALN